MQAFTAIALVGLALGACGTASPQEAGPASSQPDPTAADEAAFAVFGEALRARAASALPADASGLIGRNREWGALYSPRFQLGAGAALRTTLAARRPTDAARAFRAIEVVAESVRPDGFVPSSLPPDIGGPPSEADIASGAAFALGDLCLGVLALDATADRDAVASEARRAFVRDGLVAAVGWLLTQEPRLMEADQAAPNRLLFDARSFQACGSLTSDVEARNRYQAAADRFVRAALALQAPDGHFVEAGGHDTSYQGVALLVGEDLVLAGYAGGLPSALTAAAGWLAGRVGDDGRIDSSGNTRTCEGGETFGGVPKRVAVVDLFASLVYAGVRTDATPLTDAARRIEGWVRTHPNTNPCFP